MQVLRGFRRRAKNYRSGVTPRPDWPCEKFAESASRKRCRFAQLLAKIDQFHGPLAGKRVLEVGCGDAIHPLLYSLHGAARVDGVDLYLPLLDNSETGDLTRRIASVVLSHAAADAPRCDWSTADAAADGLRRANVHLHVMDACAMTFPDHAFDLLLSRSAMEHIIPVQRALAEMIRVVRPGGMIYHSVDPFYWLRGCHKRGVTDMPWAHARLSDADFFEFVRKHEGEEKAKKRLERIRTLNRYTLAQWREILAAAGEGELELIDYREEPNEWAARTLHEHPEVLESLLPGVDERDLVTGRINVWLRRR
jgi:ubiquinone/menaquinone biosynthesis C-methylase UbiE